MQNILVIIFVVQHLIDLRFLATKSIAKGVLTICKNAYQT